MREIHLVKDQGYELEWNRRLLEGTSHVVTGRGAQMYVSAGHDLTGKARGPAVSGPTDGFSLNLARRACDGRPRRSCSFHFPAVSRAVSAAVERAACRWRTRIGFRQISLLSMCSAGLWPRVHFTGRHQCSRVTLSPPTAHTASLGRRPTTSSPTGEPQLWQAQVSGPASLSLFAPDAF
jgi:hypothetical protein